MKGALGLASELLDQLANPAHGVEHNETQTARFHELIQRDPELHETLLGSDLDEGDVDLLSTPAWLWYLTWRRSEDASLPGEEFVDALFGSTQDLVVRLKIVEAAATDPVLVRAVSDLRRDLPLEATPRSWLRSRLFALTHSDAADAPAQAQQMAILLLQVGNEVSHLYLRALLAEPSLGREQLRELVMGLVVAGTAGDEEAVMQWRQDLGL